VQLAVNIERNQVDEILGKVPITIE